MKYVIIAPHPDDELIGCFTLFDKGLVKKVIYIDDNKERAAKARKLTSSMGVDVEFIPFNEFVAGTSKYGLSQEEDYLVPCLQDNHFKHKVVNILTRLGSKRVGYYTTQMDTEFTRPLTKELSEKKRKALNRYYPDQKSLWQYDHKYFLFEGIVYDILTSSITS